MQQNKITGNKRIKIVLSYVYLFSGLIPFVILTYFFHPAWTAEEYAQHISVVYWFAAGWGIDLFCFGHMEKVGLPRSFGFSDVSLF